jgi:hypothetical protein
MSGQIDTSEVLFSVDEIVEPELSIRTDVEHKTRIPVLFSEKFSSTRNRFQNSCNDSTFV